MAKLYITGDIHGDIDIRKLSKNNFIEGETLTKEDFVVICGDFGLIWSNPPTKTEEWWLNWLTSQPWTTLFVDGNHENHKFLNSYQIENWKGGRIHKITESIFHLMRGEVYHIAGYSVFAFGGGFSHDIYRRTENKSWWQEEMPNKSEIDNAMTNLEKCNYQVDIVLSHEAPLSLHNFMGYNRINMNPYDVKFENLANFLEYVKMNAHYKMWFLGHYHIDRRVLNYYILYDDIIEVTPSLLE